MGSGNGMSGALDLVDHEDDVVSIKPAQKPEWKWLAPHVIDRMRHPLGVILTVRVDNRLATQMLGRNMEANRPRRKKQVASIASTCQRGKGVFIAPLVFSYKGKLVDGQHRADGLSRLPDGHTEDITVLILDDVPQERLEEIISILDVHSSRTVGDLAGMILGYRIPPAVSFGVELEATNGASSGLGKPEKTKIVSAEPHVPNLVMLARSKGYRTRAPIMAAALRCMRSAGVAPVTKFFEAIVNGDPQIGGHYSSSANALIRWLDAHSRAAKETGRAVASRQEEMAKSIFAFNGWYSGKEIDRLKWYGEIPDVCRGPRAR